MEGLAQQGMLSRCPCTACPGCLACCPLPRLNLLWRPSHQILYKRPGQRVLINKVRRAAGGVQAGGRCAGWGFPPQLLPSPAAGLPPVHRQRMCSWQHARAPASSSRLAVAQQSRPSLELSRHAVPVSPPPAQLGDMVVRPTFAETMIRRVPGGASATSAMCRYAGCRAAAIAAWFPALVLTQHCALPQCHRRLLADGSPHDVRAGCSVGGLSQPGLLAAWLSGPGSTSHCC